MAIVQNYLLTYVLCLSLINFAHGHYFYHPDVRVNWTVSQDNISFHVVVRTKGWIGFGLSPTGGMGGADIVIGGIKDDGTPYLQDYHGLGNTMPVLDEQQDWILLSSGENTTHTWLKIARKLDTCDKDDWKITRDTQILIYAWGETDDIGYHNKYRGSKQRTLLDTVPTEDVSKYQVFTMQTSTMLLPKETLYWCTIHRTPNFTNERFIVGYDVFLPNEIAREFTHHVDIYRCRINDTEVLDKWGNDTGRECFEKDPLRPNYRLKYCDVIELGWATGSEAAMFPEHVGFPFYPNSFYMLETHYNNPRRVSGIRIETGHHIYYTEQKRKYTAGYLLIGSNVNYTQMLPPNSVGFTQVAHCSPWCTSYWPKDGLNVFAFEFHAHRAAKQMKVRLFRDGVEQSWFMYDAHFDYNYQQIQLFREEVKLLPGDHLTLECLYDSTWKQRKITMGGRASSDEMCMAYFYYYPRVSELAHCNSQLPAKDFLEFFDVESVEIEGEWQEDPTITSPSKWKEEPLSKIMENYNWTDDARKRYQNLHRYSKHEVECYPLYGEQRSLVTYPKIDKEYMPVDTCEM